MKKRMLVCSTVFAAALGLSGCGEKSNSSSPSTNAASTGGNPLTAPVDYLGAAAKAQQSAVKTVDTTALKSAIQLFNVDKGRYPKDLNELVEQKFIPEIPPPPAGSKIVYDPESGEVKIVRK
jgi:hypothetical protein